MNDLKCHQARLLISRQLDGEIEESSARAAEEHLQACDSCRAHREELVRCREMIGTLQQVEAPSDLPERILGSLDEKTIGGDWIETEQFCRHLVPFAAAALLVFTLLAGLWPRHLMKPGSANWNRRQEQTRQEVSTPENELALFLDMELGIASMEKNGFQRF